eukprot:11849947-Alexandrium_andersonii.AAC.1
MAKLNVRNYPVQRSGPSGHYTLDIGHFGTLPRIQDLWPETRRRVQHDEVVVWAAVSYTHLRAHETSAHL